MKNINIEIKNVSFTFPILDYSKRSIRKFFFGSLMAYKKSYDFKFTALDNISLSINKGDRLGIIGNNGAGKTTLLRLLASVYKPTSGTININGKAISFIDLTMGMNFEATGRENIIIRGIIYGLSMDKIKSLEDEIITFSGLGEFIDRPIRTYSSGMLMRLGFSIVTSIKSDIIIMDEWISTGDEKFQTKAEDKLKKIIDDSHILIIASHSKKLIENVCNKVMILEKGRIKEFTSFL